MADQKISELTVLTGVNAADDDVLAIVDTSAVETKKITRSELFTDTPTLLVGMTSANTNNDGVGLRSDGLIHGKRAGVVATFNRKTLDGSVVEISKDNAVAGVIGTSGVDLTIGTGDVGLKFNDASNRIDPWNVTTNTSVDGTFDLGKTDRRFKDLHLSGGVVFGDAGGSGTSTSNTLDSYEEGTWTPVGADASSGGNTASAGTASGFYTKIGRQVTAHCTLSNINTTGMTSGSGFFIQGLPFAHNSTTGRNVTGVVRADKINVDSTCFGMVALISSGASTVQLYQNRDNTTDTQILVSAFQSGTADLFFSITYDAT